VPIPTICRSRTCAANDLQENADLVEYLKIALIRRRRNTSAVLLQAAAVVFFLAVASAVFIHEQAKPLDAANLKIEVAGLRSEKGQGEK